MRVAHLVSTLKVGGAERFVIDICRLQRQQGINSCIVSLGSEDDDFMSLANEWQIPVHVVNTGVLRRQLILYGLLKDMDVLHFHSPHPLRSMQFVVLQLSKPRIIYTRHGAGKLLGQPWPAVHRRVRKAVDAVTFVSQEGCEVFMNGHGWLDVRNKVIDNGIDTSTIKVKASPEHRHLSLGSVGRMIELKNQKNLLMAIGLLAKSDQQRINMHFFGDGPLLDELKTLSNELESSVIFHGVVDRREQIYDAIDTLVVTSRTEGLSLAIIEAMAFGKSVIATNVGGNPRLVRDQNNGWLIDVDDANQLALRIKQLLEQPEIACEQGKQGRTRIENDFSLVNSAKQYHELYCT